MSLSADSQVRSGNLLANLPDLTTKEEEFTTLLQKPGFSIQRIVSSGQSTPEDEWYDQQDDEWVMVISGSARLIIEGEDKTRNMQQGDFMYIPAHAKHRVVSTSTSEHTVWLAIHSDKSSDCKIQDLSCKA